MLHTHKKIFLYSAYKKSGLFFNENILIRSKIQLLNIETLRLIVLMFFL